MRHSCQIWHLSCPKELFDKNKALKKGKCFGIFQTSREKLSGRWQKLFGCVLQTANYIFRGKFSEFFLIWITHFVTLGFFQKNFGCIFKTAFYAAQRKLFFQKFKFFPSYSDLELNFFWKFGRKKLKVWPNYSSMCPDELFGRNIVLQKKHFLLFQTLSQTCSKNGNFFAAFYKLQITWPEEFFRKVSLRFE